MQNFKDLKVWEKSHALTLEVYQVTNDFPTEELYGLTSQLRRSSSSVPTNLAEGTARKSSKDQANFFQISFSSSQEVEYLLLLSRDLNYLDKKVYETLHSKIVEIKAMLIGLLKRKRSQI